MDVPVGGPIAPFDGVVPDTGGVWKFIKLDQSSGEGAAWLEGVGWDSG